MDYKEYIESINPPARIKDGALRESRKRRAAFRSLMTAAAVAVVVMVSVFALRQNSSIPYTETTATQTTEATIQNFVSSGDTVKSAPRILRIGNKRYFEDRKTRISVKESDLHLLGRVEADSFFAPEEVDENLLGAAIFGIEGDTCILIKSDGKYYLFRLDY